LEFKEFTDFTVTVDNHEYFLHRVILVARCPALLGRGWSPARFKRDAFEKLLRYLYVEYIPLGMTSVPLKTLVNFMVCANELKLTDLEYHCFHLLSANITEDIVPDLFMYAEEFEYKELLDFLLSWVVGDKLQVEDKLHNLEDKLKDHNIFNRIRQRIIQGVDVRHEKRISLNNIQTLYTDLKNLYDKQNGCDFVLKNNSKEIHCHKAILGARCEFFAGVFRSGMSESQKGELIISDEQLTYSALNNLVKYFYYNTPDHIEEPMDAILILSSAGYMGLSSDFGYKHQKLLKHCKVIIASKISTDNCLEFLNVSYYLMLEDLTQKIISFIVLPQNYPVVTKKSEFKELPSAILDDIKKEAKPNIVKKKEDTCSLS